MKEFGQYIRDRRLAMNERAGGYSVRKTAALIDVQFSYLSKVERGAVAPPSEATIKRLAAVLEEDPDMLLALAGKVSEDLRNVILKRPLLFAELLRELKNTPDKAVLSLVREVRDGNW
jgi:transcriptional regulator with XRE-family HTH domain